MPNNQVDTIPRSGDAPLASNHAVALSNLGWTRFAAALFVVFFHFGKNTPLIADRAWSPILLSGPLAVSYFYVLSGFIMATVYRSIELKKFGIYWLNRFARLYPLYLLVLCWFAYAQPWTRTDLALGLFLIQAWVPGHALSMTVLGWSLSIEIAFYLVFPWVMVFARRIGTVRFACCSISFWLVSQASVTLLSYILQRNVSQWLIDLTFYFPASHLNSFLIGMTAALLTSKWAPPMWLAAFVAATSLITSGFLILHVPGLSRFNIVVEDGLHAPLFAAFVASIVKINSRVMRSRLSVLLGDISYAVYISQLAVMLILHKYLRLGSTPKNGYELSLFLAVLFIFSFLMYVTFESPARAAIRRMFLPLVVSPALATSPTRGRARFLYPLVPATSRRNPRAPRPA
jgi:peptidoglycan/LPS O-acetylase OafA/YrhL